jgi:hypothetical protein
MANPRILPVVDADLASSLSGAKAMSHVIVLDEIELIPVVELEPCRFSTQTRTSPSNWEVSDDWFGYWADCLADSGITELRPLRRGSWHVPTVNFDVASNLQRFLVTTFQDWGGIDSLSDPDFQPVLNGGLALRCSASDVLIEPGCCADLGNANNWEEAARCRDAGWQMLWIGHPFLSVRFQAPWLILSERHESDNPSERWAVLPEELSRAAAEATSERQRFARELAIHLRVLGYRGDPIGMGQKLMGLLT